MSAIIETLAHEKQPVKLLEVYLEFFRGFFFLTNNQVIFQVCFLQMQKTKELSTALLPPNVKLAGCADLNRVGLGHTRKLKKFGKIKVKSQEMESIQRGLLQHSILLKLGNCGGILVFKKVQSLCGNMAMETVEIKYAISWSLMFNSEIRVDGKTIYFAKVKAFVPFEDSKLRNIGQRLGVWPFAIQHIHPNSVSSSILHNLQLSSAEMLFKIIHSVCRIKWCHNYLSFHIKLHFQ